MTSPRAELVEAIEQKIMFPLLRLNDFHRRMRWQHTADESGLLKFKLVEFSTGAPLVHKEEYPGTGYSKFHPVEIDVSIPFAEADMATFLTGLPGLDLPGKLERGTGETSDSFAGKIVENVMELCRHISAKAAQDPDLYVQDGKNHMTAFHPAEQSGGSWIWPAVATLAGAAVLIGAVVTLAPHASAAIEDALTGAMAPVTESYRPR